MNGFICYSKNMSLSSRKFLRTQSKLYFDGRFTTPGTYTSLNGNFSGTYPAPYTSAQYVPSETSNTVIYTADTKQQPWWPDPYAPWSPLAGAFNSYNNETQPTARAQALGGWQFKTGDDFYITWVVNVPSAVGSFWPNYLADSDWNLLAQFHGAPWNGSPAIAVNVVNISGQICLIGADGTGRALWSHAINVDTWVKATLHTVINPVGGKGLLQVWVDGQRKTLTLPTARANYDTSKPILITRWAYCLYRYRTGRYKRHQHGIHE